MKKSPVIKSLSLLLLVALLIAACGSENMAVSDGELLLTFDGDSCIYEGPALLKVGPATLHFKNQSEEIATAGLMRHAGDETIQDMIEFLGEDPLTEDLPPWAHGQTPPKSVAPGEGASWDLAMGEGIYSMACFSAKPPYPMWFGTGLTVVN